MDKNRNVLNKESGTDAEIVRLVIILIASVINQTEPEVLHLDTETVEAIYQFASRHMMRAIVAAGFEQAGYGDQRSTKELGRVLRRSILFENAWNEITRKFEEAGIDYLPLKGVVLKQYYPRPELREMSDHDILIDPSRAGDVKDIMESLGYVTKKFGMTHHDVYHKEPVLNFEMHREFFHVSHGAAIYDYYKDVSRFLKGKGRKHTFSADDFYIYMVTHEYKHYANSGTGLRSLLDTYVYLNQVSLNLAYVEQECIKLGIADFEQQNRALALRLFSGKDLSEEDVKMLQYVTSSGVYGSVDHRVSNQIKKLGGGKTRYMFSRFSVPFSHKNPGYSAYAGMYPVFYKNKILLPLLPFYRTIRAIRSGRFSAELKAVQDSSKNEK